MLLRALALMDSLSLRLGRGLAWLSLLLVLAMTAVVLLRYGFGLGSAWLQDALIYLHASLFMLGASYALRRDAHVRVDVFYRRLSVRGQAWVNLGGTLVFLLPFALFVLWSSWPYVRISWLIREGSADPGGIPALFLLKSLIPAMAVLLLMQGCAEILRALAILGGRLAPEPAVSAAGEGL